MRSSGGRLDRPVTRLVRFILVGKRRSDAMTRKIMITDAVFIACCREEYAPPALAPAALIERRPRRPEQRAWRFGIRTPAAQPRFSTRPSVVRLPGGSCPA